MSEYVEDQKKRKEEAIRSRKIKEERKMTNLGFSLKELHDFPTPLQRAKFNKELIKIMNRLENVGRKKIR